MAAAETSGAAGSPPAPPERPGSLAAAIRRRDGAAIATVLDRVIVPDPDLLIPRPWGGLGLFAHKGVACPPTGPRIGESFELSAAPSDPESRRWPSRITLPDGSRLTIADLLCACPEILGPAHVHALGRELPLLPKLLDIHQLLSVQAHPQGQPEAYVIVAADPGATLGLGFARPPDWADLRPRLHLAAGWQKSIEAALVDAPALAAQVGRFLGGADLGFDPAADPRLRPWAAELAQLRDLGATIRGHLNTIEVRPGMWLYNAVPHPSTGRVGATVHALGNPEGKRILAFEIRLAGPTLRLWDHGRLPARPLHIDAAVAELGTEAEDPSRFVVALDGGAASQRCIDDEVLTIDRLRPGAGLDRAGEGTAQVLHVLSGSVAIHGPRGVTTLVAGRTGLIPASWPGYRISSANGGTVVAAAMKIPATGLGARTHALQALRATVSQNLGPSRVMVIANGGDREPVSSTLQAQARQLFRADGATEITVHEEQTRRGQLLGMLDALRAWRQGPSVSGVALGIMLPGQGTRLSPLTQALHGIKPHMPMPIRPQAHSPWLNAGAASLWSWVHVAHHLERWGFAGVAWKWGDEPQLPSTDLAVLDLDLTGVDAVRFGTQTQVTEDLARHKEWLLRGQAGQLVAQLRRRPQAELMARLAIAPAGTRALVHIGSPALSWTLLAALDAEFGGLDGWLDIDGYLFEALTHDDEAWRAEITRDPKLAAFVQERPDFYASVLRVRDRVEQTRGYGMRIDVIDFGDSAYWGDMGQLSHARASFAAVAQLGPSGEFARRLAALDDGVPDPFGNRIYGVQAHVPQDGSVTNSVIVDSWLGRGRVDSAVIFDSELGVAELSPGAVVLRSTVAHLHAGPDALVFRAVDGGRLDVAASHVHTSIPEDPQATRLTVQGWSFDMGADPGQPSNYGAVVGANPASFADKFRQMRQRDVASAAIDAAVREQLQVPIAQSFGVPSGYFSKQS